MVDVGIVGQGYVGLPIAVEVARAGFKVFGIDNDTGKVKKLNSGQSVVEDIKDSELSVLLESGQYFATEDFRCLQTAEVILLCVPTPLDDKGLPDLSALISASSSVAKNMRPNALIIVESSVAPGTTRNVVLEVIEKESGIDRKDINLAFSPERIDPQNKNWSLKNTPKIVAGLSLESRRIAKEFYLKFVDTVVECDSLEVAETAKLLENSFRLINISFINELAIFCQKLGVNINEVIKAASTKPYGFMSFYPSVGVGGHCIPVDPVYLAKKAQEINAPSRMIGLAIDINQEMPKYFVNRAEEQLGGLGGKNILVVGISYKPNVSDLRESPVLALITGLRERGSRVQWHDELVKVWDNEHSIPISDQYDLAILATPHDYFDLTKLGDIPVLYTRGSI
jgi:UDP-N-acetyl-D-glucosamine dehydrogenase